MNKMKKLFSKPVLLIILTGLFVSFALPLLSSFVGISKIHRIIYLFLVINPLLSILSGWLIRRATLNFAWLFFFPAVFAISIWWRFAQYNYWLAGVYLILGLIAYLLIPVSQSKTVTH
ncbi:hypothetical protein [Lapidilactobacillus bayanensis]|uniref:hypothetical protein n=1 Tax=Lapidilactobacillus bayanensis TaxID=2485998 RepID=UPI000F7B391D|nr:hypothetical protein [Lapidilactobacillus bayanensis]